MGDFGCLSFHETKNIHCGEGGALLVNNEKYVERAEIIREKGTNRSKFFRGQVEKYRWVDIGSSYLPGELTAAFLSAQLEETENITKSRLEVWKNTTKFLKIWNLVEKLEDQLFQRNANTMGIFIIFFLIRNITEMLF